MIKQNSNNNMHGTTILAVRRKNNVVIAGDGQVSLGNTVMKSNAVKVRRLANNKVIAGFAGATADAFTLFERLEAMMAVADKSVSLIVSGTGDVVEPEDGLIGIGSGGTFALAAARALIDQEKLSAEEVAKKAMAIASDICIYTNSNFTIEKL